MYFFLFSSETLLPLLESVRKIICFKMILQQVSESSSFSPFEDWLILIITMKYTTLENDPTFWDYPQIKDYILQFRCSRPALPFFLFHNL